MPVFPVTRLNVVVAVLAALTVAVSMRIVGILLIAALMVLPVIAANRVAWSLRSTFALSMAFGLGSVISGLCIAYYADTPPGGTIVLVAAGAFALCAAGSALARADALESIRMIGGMSRVVLTGSTLTLDDVLAVARGGAQVEIDAAALDAMAAARAVVDRSIADGTPAYGVTTGVGSRKVFDVAADGHDRLLVRQHRISQGAPVAPEVVRAAVLRLANALARATTVARPELASHLVAALNDGRLPQIRTLGSIGQSDLAQMADLADGVLGSDFELARGEAIALLNQSAFATGYAALAFADALVLLDVFDHAGALDLEALGANRNSVHPAIGDARPYPGLQATARPPRRAARGQRGGARATCRTRSRSGRSPSRTAPPATRFGFVGSQLAIELNAAQSNPLVVVAEDRVISVGNFEMQPLVDRARHRPARARPRDLDGGRARSEAPAAQPDRPHRGSRRAARAGRERAQRVRHRDPGDRGRGAAARPTRLVRSRLDDPGRGDRGPDDDGAARRARRLEEMVGLGARVASIELMLAAQACDLRGAKLGVGTARLHDSVRRFVPFLAEGAALPDLEPLVEEIRSGRICA